MESNYCEEHDHNCPEFHPVRPATSSLISAPSWSSGFGADPREDQQARGLSIEVSDEEEDAQCDHHSDELSLSSSSSAIIKRRAGCQCQQQQPQLMREPVANTSPPFPKINIEIPTVILANRKTAPISSSTSSTFHVYQMNFLTGTGARWSVYRRYSQFLSLHQNLKSLESVIGKFPFPPKRRLNSKASTIVQDRRERLEEYMRKLCDFVGSIRLVDEADCASYQILSYLTTNGPSSISSTQNTSDQSAAIEPEGKNQSVIKLFYQFISPKSDHLLLYGTKMSDYEILS